MSSETHNDDFALLRSYPSAMSARMVVEALANADIPAMMKSNEMFGAGTGLGTFEPTRVDVFVRQDQLKDAQHIADGIIDAT